MLPTPRDFDPNESDLETKFSPDALGRIVQFTYYNGGAMAVYEKLITPGIDADVVLSNGALVYAIWPGTFNGSIYEVSNGNLYYMHRDWVGNARIAHAVKPYSSSGVFDVAYSPYGEQYDVFNGSTGLPLVSFAGLSQDFMAGIMWDTPNRELSTVGRWLSPDPVRAGWNAYAYPTNPNSFVDPTGLDSCWDHSSYEGSGSPPPCTWDGGPAGPGGVGCTMDGAPADCGTVFGAMQAGAYSFAGVQSKQVQTGWSIIGVDADGTVTVGGCLGIPGCQEQELPVYDTIWTVAVLLSGPQGSGTSQGPNPATGASNRKPVPCEDRACELARAINKTGVQTLQSPCFVPAFYAASAASATSVALAGIGSETAAFPAFSETLAGFGPTITTSTTWFQRTRQLGTKAFAVVAGKIADAIGSACQ